MADWRERWGEFRERVWRRSFAASLEEREAMVEFLDRVYARLEAGEREYGNNAGDRPRSELLGEVREELEDVVGWGFWADLPLETVVQVFGLWRHLAGDAE